MHIQLIDSSATPAARQPQRPATTPDDDARPDGSGALPLEISRSTGWEPRSDEVSATQRDTNPVVDTTSTGPDSGAPNSAAPDAAGVPPAGVRPVGVRPVGWQRIVLVHVGWAALGAVLATVWVFRGRISDVFGPWWYVAVPLALVAIFLRERPATPKSAAHPALLVKRSNDWNRKPIERPLGRRSAVPNVFVHGDSFAAAAWPASDLVTARRWTMDASERVASRFGTQVAVLVGADAAGAPGRDHVSVVALDADGSMRDALWDLVAPVDPDLPILFVTDDDDAARMARAHGAQIMPCTGWMTLADRLTADH